MIIDEIKRGNQTEDEYYIQLRNQVDKLILKSNQNQKQIWASIVQKPALYPLNTPIRATAIQVAARKFSEFLIKTNEEEKIVNRQFGTRVLVEKIDKRIIDRGLGAPIKVLRLLKSSNISVILDNEEQAQKLREEYSWIIEFGVSARLASNLYSIITYRISTSTLPTKDGELQYEEAIRALK